jgi:hypothetical protein
VILNKANQKLLLEYYCASSQKKMKQKIQWWGHFQGRDNTDFSWKSEPDRT